MNNLIKIFILPVIIGLCGGVIIGNYAGGADSLSGLISDIRDYRKQTISDRTAQPASPTLSPLPTPSITPQPTRTVRTNSQTNPAAVPTTTEWGVAKQVGDHTYTINVGNDSNMASPSEVFQALNAYRSAKGSGQLSWDDKLAGYAQQRADYFKNISNVDGHAGFNSYLENENGFDQLGFMRLGENSYYGGALTGTHLIEWVFSQSPGHDANQLDSGWSHVGIGTTGSSVNLVFGGEKM